MHKRKHLCSADLLNISVAKVEEILLKLTKMLVLHNHAVFCVSLHKLL